MRAIVTGASGTVGKALIEALEAAGHEAIAWDRARVSIEDYGEMKYFVESAHADIIYHLALASKPTGIQNESWLVNYHWPSELAWISRELGLRFVYTSTVMVWNSSLNGPYYPTTPPNETEGYGAEKHRTEERVFAQNPLATVARLGWQIGREAGSNNMVDYLTKTFKADGRIRASRLWQPACSFVEDTADALVRLGKMDSGLYLLDSNTDSSFFHIVCALQDLLATNWKIEMNEDFVYDQRMVDGRLRLPPLRDRLKTLH